MRAPMLFTTVIGTTTLKVTKKILLIQTRFSSRGVQSIETRWQTYHCRRFFNKVAENHYRKACVRCIYTWTRLVQFGDNWRVSRRINPRWIQKYTNVQ